MKAIQAADRGGYDALRLVDIPRPQPRAGEALVRVTSAGVTLVRKLARVSGFSLFAASAEEQATAYATVLPLIASGEIVPAHDRSFPLDRAPEALRHLIEDRPFGTVTLTVGA